MSGVIIDDVQWEHCNCCTGWVKIENLGYEPPSKKYPHGRDLCIKCVNALPQRVMERVRPAASWIAQRS